jgi:hypothetical protein
MIVWTGRGILIVLVFMAGMFIGNAILPENMTDYVFVFAGLMTAIFSWFAGNAWNTNNERVVTDDETGRKMILRSSHGLFWIPMQYWGIILTVLSIVILAQNSMSLAVGATAIFGSIIIIYRLKKSKRIQLETLPASEQFQSLAEISKIEEERIKKRAEKEEHSRFMPK